MESQTKTVITPETEKRPIYFDTRKLPWQTCTDKHLNADFLDMKLILDRETGLTINLSVYPKGYYKPKHIHDNAHGIFVLKGTLKTDDGEYGPGTFVWYPEGTVMSHGATEREDCTFLYIQDRAGKLHYLQ